MEITIVAIVCGTVFAMTLVIGILTSRYYSVEHTRNRVLKLEEARLEAQTQQALSMDKTRQMEITGGDGRMNT